MHTFAVIWDDILRQQHLPRFLRAATIALFANPGSTLVDMHTFLTDDTVRHQMLQAVRDPTVRQFWQSYDELSASARRQQVEPLIGRLESLFMGRSLVRNIVGQRETSIDFRTAIENGEIIFIKLPVKTLAQDARLIGTLLVSQLHAAIFSFADMPEEQRPGFSLYVDEFQHFATPDFAEMFTEGRKFAVRVTVAHQYRGQLPAFLQESTMTARTTICFQTTPGDGREMAHLYLNGETTIQPEDTEPHAIEHLLHYGSDDLLVQTFIDQYLRPLQMQKKGGSIEIANPGFQSGHIPFWLLGVKPPTDKPKVADPTLLLNHLLYEVMKTGQSTGPVLAGIVRGFSNCGIGFYGHCHALGELLTGDIRFPPHLVVEGAPGTFHWTRRPENGKEQLYHFLFFLRMTKLHLADKPIGKKTSLSVTDVSHMLTQLPRRAAFVRSGDDTGVIYTNETPLEVAGVDVRERLHTIRERTRQKYCSPVPVDTDTDVTTKLEVPELPRWEEVE